MRPLLINTVLLNQEKNHYCSIHYNGFRNVTYQSWQGNLSTDELKKGYHSSLDVLTKTACTSVINDCSAVEGVEPDNLSRFTQHWLSEALDKGVKYIAQVTNEDVPPEPFAAMKALSVIEGNFEMEIFDNIDEAMHWIAFKNDFEA